MPTYGQYPYLYQPSYPMQKPVAPFQPDVAQSIQGLIKVTGIDGAKAYQMPPNSVVPLFDANEDVMYIKSTDGAGFPTIREFTFNAVEAPQSQQEYVSRNEFDKLVEEVKELANGKQPVSATRTTKQTAAK